MNISEFQLGNFETNWDQAALQGLFIAGSAAFLQLTENEGLNQAWGAGFEIIRWNGEFQKIDRIAVRMWNFENGEFHLIYWMYYKYIDDFFNIISVLPNSLVRIDCVPPPDLYGQKKLIGDFRCTAECSIDGFYHPDNGIIIIPSLLNSKISMVTEIVANHEKIEMRCDFDSIKSDLAILTKMNNLTK